MGLRAPLALALSLDRHIMPFLRVRPSIPLEGRSFPPPSGAARVCLWLGSGWGLRCSYIVAPHWTCISLPAYGVPVEMEARPLATDLGNRQAKQKETESLDELSLRSLFVLHGCDVRQDVSNFFPNF